MFDIIIIVESPAFGICNTKRCVPPISCYVNKIQFVYEKDCLVVFYYVTINKSRKKCMRLIILQNHP